MNSIEYFIKDCIDKSSKKEFVEYKKLYELYNKYCEEQDIRTESKTLFTRYFLKLGVINSSITKDGQRNRVFRKILIKNNIIKTIMPQPPKIIPDYIVMADFIDDFTDKPLLKPMTKDEVYQIYLEWCKLKNHVPISKNKFKIYVKIK